jgi:hypothetical protein
MGKRKKGGKAKAPLLMIEHREQRGDYATYPLGTPGTWQCTFCRESRVLASFVDAEPSRYLHRGSCMRARCLSHPCGRCCDLECRYCRKYVFVRCPCCDGPRKYIKDPTASHYPTCRRAGEAHSRSHPCSVPEVQPNVVDADLGSGAPAERPARQVVGEAGEESEAGEAAELADPPFHIGDGSPSESEGSGEEAEAGEVPGGPSDSPSDREESKEVCCFCFTSAFEGIQGLAAHTAMLVFRDGIPEQLEDHYAPAGGLMLTWRALHDTMHDAEIVAEAVRDVHARFDPLEHEEAIAQNYSARCQLRRLGALVDQREKALQVALGASVKPPDPIGCLVRWNEDVAYWASCVTRHLRFPVAMGLLGPGRIPR